MHGLKNVSHRHDDALSRIGWADLERLLATYYREVGWWVEHAGTGGTGAKFDGGVDLRIRRDAEVVLVQCKHWNAKQVPHNAVHELLGLMVNEGATGAVLVSSGEFTRAAIDAAQRHGHVKLVDGETLRGMLGPLAEPEPPPDAAPAKPARPVRPRTNSLLWLVALVGAIGFVLIVRTVLHRTADTAVEPSEDTRRAPMARTADASYEESLPAPVAQAVAAPAVAMPPPRPPTEAEIRESQRKADEAMRLIADDTPEL
ncbi:MAG: restriction endonuclease [Lysobacter sp.]|nr:restriction endonuclease [Lysobacter sp.]